MLLYNYFINIIKSIRLNKIIKYIFLYNILSNESNKYYLTKSTLLQDIYSVYLTLRILNHDNEII